MNKLLTIFLLVLVNSASVSAQKDSTLSSCDGQCTKLDYLAKSALNSNYDIQKSLIDLNIALETIERKLAAFYPRLDVSLGLNNIKKFGQLPGIDSVLLQGKSDVNSSSLVGSLSWNLYQGGYDINSYRGAKLKKAFLKNESRFIRYSVLRQMVALYNEVKKSKLNVAVSQLELEIEQANYSIKSSSFKENLIPFMELEESEANIEKLEKRIAFHRYKHKVAKELLINFSRVTFGSGALNVSLEPENYSVLFERLNLKPTRNFELELLENKYKLSNYDIKKVKSKYLPKVDLSFQYTHSALSQHDIIDAFETMESDKRQISLMFSWNLFEGFATNKDYRIASYNKQRIHTEILDKQRDLVSEQKRFEVEKVSIEEEIDRLKNEKAKKIKKLALLKEEVNQGYDISSSQTQVEKRIKIIIYEIILRQYDLAILDVEFMELGMVKI